MFLTIIPLLWGWLGGTSLLQIHMIGFLLGFAGASFAVSLSLASRWYPPQYQGLAMGIVYAGNSGTALATFSDRRSPRLTDGTVCLGLR